MSYETILYSSHAPIATITLNRPEQLNTIVATTDIAASTELKLQHQAVIMVLTPFVRQSQGPMPNAKPKTMPCHRRPLNHRPQL
ncbi:hypothetical protein [Mycobacterium sp.]|uniref:hypothetical protein n=1 Tax=Mycobacterium sp. TaxID=1785 RepID=UPI002BE64169|nr:hypothetical protein [Mycobacterium sp.]HME48866.1 hypothetical protein [Mycobacterium sp.]